MFVTGGLEKRSEEAFGTQYINGLKFRLTHDKILAVKRVRLGAL